MASSWFLFTQALVRGALPDSSLIHTQRRQSEQQQQDWRGKRTRRGDAAHTGSPPSQPSPSLRSALSAAAAGAVRGEARKTRCGATGTAHGTERRAHPERSFNANRVLRFHARVKAQTGCPPFLFVSLSPSLSRWYQVSLPDLIRHYIHYWSVHVTPKYNKLILTLLEFQQRGHLVSPGSLVLMKTTHQHKNNEARAKFVLIGWGQGVCGSNPECKMHQGDTKT